MKTLPDSRQTLKMMVAEGDLVSVCATFAGTQAGFMRPFPPSGKRMAIAFFAMLRLEEGKIAEMWVT
jgi:predicted ester cyclase